MAVRPRAPELWPGPMFGSALPDARGTRLRVTEAGAVELVVRGGTPREVTQPGEVTRLSWLHDVGWLASQRFRPKPERGLLGLWAGERLLAAVNLQTVASPASRFVDDILGPEPSWIAASGLDAFADGLGLAVEPATTSEARQLRRVPMGKLVSLRSRPRVPVWLRTLAALLAVVASFWTWEAARQGYAAWVAPGALLLTGFAVVTLWTARRQAARWANAPLAPGDRAAISTQPTSPQGHPEFTESLQVGSHEIVAVARDGEWWLPGPELGGVTRAVVHDGDAVLLARGAHPMAGFGAGLFGANLPQVLAALESVGVRVERAPTPLDARAWQPLHTGAGLIAKPIVDPAETGSGNLVCTSQQWTAFLGLLPGALMTTAQSPTVGIAVLVGAVGLLAMRLDALRIRRNLNRSRGIL